MPDITLTSSDGHSFGAYQAIPKGAVRGGVVVIQEIFGVNAHIRTICDRLADDGYLAMAPAMFDRVQRDFQSGYSSQEVEVARSFTSNPNWEDFLKDTDAARKALSNAGKVCIVGFCFGGSISFLAATRLVGFSAASGFYGHRVADFADEIPQCPVQLHYGEQDQGIPMSNVDIVRSKRKDCDIYVYEDAGHGFNCDIRGSYHETAANLAWSRTMDLFDRSVA